MSRHRASSLVPAALLIGTETITSVVCTTVTSQTLPLQICLPRDFCSQSWSNKRLIISHCPSCNWDVKTWTVAKINIIGDFHIAAYPVARCPVHRSVPVKATSVLASWISFSEKGRIQQQLLFLHFDFFFSGQCVTYLFVLPFVSCIAVKLSECVTVTTAGRMWLWLFLFRKKTSSVASPLLRMAPTV